MAWQAGALLPSRVGRQARFPGRLRVDEGDMKNTTELAPILVGVDLSAASLAALRRARLLSEPTRRPLVVCMVNREPPEDAALEEARSSLESLAPEATIVIRIGSPFIELIRMAREEDAHLIVIGATGRHTYGRRTLGVNADRVARKADRPVLVVRLPPKERYRSVLVGLDGSADAAQSALLARELAPRARIIGVLAALPVGEDWLRVRGFSDRDQAAYRIHAEEEARDRLSQIITGLPIDESEVLLERPEAGLLGAALRHAAELVAVGRRGVSPVASILLGSVGHHLVHEAPCDVLVYRSQDLVFQPP